MATSDNLKLIPDPKNTLIVAREDGSLYVADFTYNPEFDDPNEIDWELSVSKLLVGKLEERRTRFLTLEEIELENIVHTGQPPIVGEQDSEVTVYGSSDGKNIDKQITPTLAENLGGYVKYRCRITAKNFSIQLRSSFTLNTIVCTYHNHGRR